MKTAYRCRAYPDQAQQQVLARTFGCVLVVWNQTLAARRARWQQDRKSTSYAQADAALTAMKKDPDLAFLSAVSSVPLQQTLRHQQNAFTAFFANRAGYPRFKSRRDFLHRASTGLVRAADTIVIEDLNVAGTLRNHTLARAISDCAWGEFRRQLAYKCQRYGRTLVVIDRWSPSSKTCSACGHLLAKLSLSTRHRTCPSCHARHNRDLSAAKNILAAGLAVTACGAGVRHRGETSGAAGCETGTPAGDGRNPVLRGGSSQRCFAPSGTS